MTARALIIAIEDYPASTSIAGQLPGTIAGADTFRNWLINKKGVLPSDILVCARSDVAWRTAGTSRDEIVEEIVKLVQAGKDDTAELYFFFSGHGFSYSDSPYETQTDALVGSDFIDPDNSGGECLKLQEIQLRLWKSLGPGDHYYFIDACRNSIKEEDIQVLGLGKSAKKFPESVFGRPTWYTLFSTVQGLAAKVTSGFSAALVEGLNGKGRAKRWESDRMYVTFEVLCDFMKKKVSGQEIDSNKKGPGSGFILELKPVPTSGCSIKIDNALSSDAFQLTIRNALGPAGSHSFQGDSFQIPLNPFDYFFEISHSSAAVVQVDPVTNPVDVYEPCNIRFEKKPGPAPSPPSPETGTVMVAGAPKTTIELEDIANGLRFDSEGHLSNELFPGTYRVKMREFGVTVASNKFTVDAGKAFILDLLDRPASPIRENILGVASHPAPKGMADFSEQLGAMANWDLSVWLSVMGASRIVAPYGDFSQLMKLPLETFENVVQDESPVYVLAGFENADGPFYIGLSDGPDVAWEELQNVSGMKGLYHYRFAPSSGFHCLSLKMPSRATLSIAVYCLPNRVTLVIFSGDQQGGLKIRQYLPPIHSTMQYLDPTARSLLNPFLLNPLASVRMMALAQGQFARNRPAEPPAGSEENLKWHDLIEGNWLDPVMSLMAAYEIIRRGKLNQERGFIETMITNFRSFFPGIGDIEALAKMAGLNWTVPQTPPLFLDGLLAIEELQDELPLPVDRLNYDDVWTSWRSAVRADADSAGVGESVTAGSIA